MKEACLHYGAFDSPNHAKYIKGMASEVSGTEETGYQLRARGLTEATTLVKGLVKSA